MAFAIMVSCFHTEVCRGKFAVHLPISVRKPVVPN